MFYTGFYRGREWDAIRDALMTGISKRIEQKQAETFLEEALKPLKESHPEWFGETAPSEFKTSLVTSGQPQGGGFNLSAIQPLLTGEGTSTSFQSTILGSQLQTQPEDEQVKAMRSLIGIVSNPKIPATQRIQLLPTLLQQLVPEVPEEIKKLRAFRQYPQYWEMEKELISLKKSPKIETYVNPATGDVKQIDINRELPPEGFIPESVWGTITKVSKPPASIEEYNFAVKQGYRGSFADFKKELKKAEAPIINMGTATKTEIEKGIIETQNQIDAFNEIEKLFQDDFLKAKGQAKAWALKKGEWSGVAKLMPKQQEWLEKYQQWYQLAKSQFLAYRKWVTGVAGGQKEMEEIAKSYPDPDNNSPTQYKANLKQAKLNALRLQKRYQMFLSQGIIPTKKQLSSIPLNQIPLTPEEMKAVGIKEMGDGRFTILDIKEE